MESQKHGLYYMMVWDKPASTARVGQLKAAPKPKAQGPRPKAQGPRELVLNLN